MFANAAKLPAKGCAGTQVSFDDPSLIANIAAFVDAVNAARGSDKKGAWLGPTDGWRDRRGVS